MLRHAPSILYLCLFQKSELSHYVVILAAEWWSTYGGGCPNLARLAIRILSQTSSLIRSKPGRVPLEEMHETKNCIEHQRLNDLAFVQYNLWLRQR